jgi:hypothetical protein
MTRCCRPDCWRLFADARAYDQHRDDSGVCVDPATVLYLDRPVFRAGLTESGSVCWSLTTFELEICT